MMTFGEKFRKARRVADLTQRQVGDALGVTGQFVYKIERGLAQFPAERLLSLPPEMRLAVVDALIEEIERHLGGLREHRIELVSSG